MIMRARSASFVFALLILLSCDAAFARAPCSPSNWSCIISISVQGSSCHATSPCGGDAACPGYKGGCGDVRDLLNTQISDCLNGQTRHLTGLNPMLNTQIDSIQSIVHIGEGGNGGFSLTLANPALIDMYWEPLDEMCKSGPGAVLAFQSTLGTLSVARQGTSFALTFEGADVQTVEVYRDGAVVDTFQAVGTGTLLANVPAWPVGLQIRRSLADSSVVGVAAAWGAAIPITKYDGQTVMGDGIGVFAGSTSPVDSMAVMMTDIPAMRLVYEADILSPIVVTGVPTMPIMGGWGLVSPRPNPFTRTMAMPFSLGAAGQAEVRVYDTSGRLVRHIDGGKLGSGHQSIVWDGCNEAGRMLPAGAYFYQVIVNQKVIGSRKVVFLHP